MTIIANSLLFISAVLFVCSTVLLAVIGLYLWELFFTLPPLPSPPTPLTEKAHSMSSPPCPSPQPTPTAYTTSSRYGATRSLSPLGAQSDGTRQYILWGESRYVRGGHGMIDFEGGPFVSTGEFLDSENPQPVRLVDCVGQIPCVGAEEIVIGAQWIDRDHAAHALGEPVELLDPQRKRSFALITTRFRGRKG